MAEKRRGRPPKTTESRDFIIHLRLRCGEHDNIIRFLEAVPSGHRARAMIRALNDGELKMQHHGDDDPQVDRLLDDLTDSLIS